MNYIALTLYLDYLWIVIDIIKNNMAESYFSSSLELVPNPYSEDIFI